MALVNVWHLRKVAEASARPCDICYKPTANVMITPDKKDHFYICLGHIKDRGFATPIIDEAEVAAKKKKEEMDREVEAVKKEYDEKMKKKKNDKEKKSKEKGKAGSEKKEDHEKGEKEDEKDGVAEKEKDDKIKAITAGTNADDTPRIYALQKVFYQKRVDRIRNAEIAMRNRERLKNPAFFPSVPKDSLG